MAEDLNTGRAARGLEQGWRLGRGGGRRPSAVVLPAGEEASGMATMLAGLLTDNLRDFPSRARAAAIARGAMVLQASDRAATVTLSFQPGQVTVADGLAPGAAVLYGPWLELAKLCSAQASPAVSLARGRVHVTKGHPMSVIPVGAYALSVPASFYADPATLARRRRVRHGALFLSGAVIAAVGIHARRNNK